MSDKQMFTITMPDGSKEEVEEEWSRIKDVLRELAKQNKGTEVA